MNIKLYKIICIKTLILIFFFIIFFYNYSLAIESKIIVKINNKIITNTDIKNEANYLKALNPRLSKLGEEQILIIAKNSLIREKIKETETKKFKKNSISQDYLETIIEKIFKNIGLKNKDQFKKHINDFNIDLSMVEDKLISEALWNQLIYQKFNTKIKIDEDKIKEQIKSYKQYSNSYLLSEILFNVNENEKAEDLYNKIKKSIINNGFENTASIFSISETSKTGGKLDWINEGSVNNEILKQISILKKGENTKPILIPGGFLILKVEDIRSIEKKIDIKSELVQRIKVSQNEQLNQYSNIYFNKIKKEIIIDEK